MNVNYMKLLNDAVLGDLYCDIKMKPVVYRKRSILDGLEDCFEKSGKLIANSAKELANAG